MKVGKDGIVYCTKGEFFGICGAICCDTIRCAECPLGSCSINANTQIILRLL